MMSGQTIGIDIGKSVHWCIPVVVLAVTLTIIIMLYILKGKRTE